MFLVDVDLGAKVDRETTLLRWRRMTHTSFFLYQQAESLGQRQIGVVWRHVWEYQLGLKKQTFVKPPLICVAQLPRTSDVKPIHLALRCRPSFSNVLHLPVLLLLLLRQPTYLRCSVRIAGTSGAD